MTGETFANPATIPVRMGKYDTALKLVLQKWGAGIVHQLTGDAIARWCSPEFPKVSTQFADLLAETESARLWHLELQAANDPDMPFRMLEYSGRAHRVYGRFPEQCVLYVGREPLRMDAEIRDEDLWFRYRLVDIRELDGERLLSSGDVGDSIVAILTGLRGSQEVVQRVLKAIACLEESERQEALGALLLIAGLRELEEMIEQEARKMPVFDDILENKVLGREFKRGRQEGREEGLHDGELKILRRLIAARFGQVPPAVEERLSKLSSSELEDLSARLLDARTTEELLD